MTRIVIALPRGRRFGPDGATAIDLCVRDFVRFSRYKEATIVVGEPIAQPFADIDFRAVARAPNDNQLRYARRLADFIATLSPDVIVAHQHMPSAVRIAKALAPTPVLIHRHNEAKRRRNVLSRWRDQADYKAFARTIWVSDFCRDGFAGLYPALAARAIAVHNGLDFDDWRPRETRAKEILFVGRLTREKGCLETAHALARVLPAWPDWRARLVLSRRQVDADYADAVQSALAPLGGRAEIVFDLAHDAVRDAFCSAEIALAPSLYHEPFGRTAIEAFAGGAALITSLRGGLNEIAAGHAEAAVPPTTETIAAALDRLISDEAYRRALAAKARAHGQARFDIRPISARLDALYQQVLAERLSGT